MSRAGDLISVTPDGLYCADGGFHIDPWRPVDRAVITHAHADHARPGSTRYLTTPQGVGVLRIRMGGAAAIDALHYGRTLNLGDVRVSLHPAGHVLGSAQVRIEPRDGPTWVISGDYKTAAGDRTCAPYEPVRCHVFLTESTFGLPIYSWPEPARVERDLNEWWRANAAAGRTSIVAAYALGKTQRILSALDPAIGPIGLHGAGVPLTDAYRAAGVDLPHAVHAAKDAAADLKGRGLIIAPPSALGSTWPRRFAGAGGVRTAMVSGWMRVRGRRRWRAADRGFVLSDHADWHGLLDAIQATGATRIGVTHGYAEPLARYLREVRGLDSFVAPTRFNGEEDQPDPLATADPANPPPLGPSG